MPITIAKAKCKNPACATGLFTPRRGDQVFCDAQCKNHYHNQRKRQARDVTFSKEKALKHNFRVLERLFVDPKYKAGVSQLILEHEGVALAVFTDYAVLTTSGRRVLWSHDYGLELLKDSTAPFFKIHKR